MNQDINNVWGPHMPALCVTARPVVVRAQNNAYHANTITNNGGRQPQRGMVNFSPQENKTATISRDEASGCLRHERKEGVRSGTPDLPVLKSRPSL